MIRTLVWFCYFWISLIGLMPEYFHIKKMADEHERFKRADKNAKKWAGNLLRLAGTNISVEGIDKLPDSGSVLFISNHQSSFDIPIMINSVPTEKGFISKYEMKKMPIVSEWMKYLKCIFMDRSDIRQQMRSINEGAENIKSGYPMVLFPEGTRSDDGVLLNFKPGGLKLALKSGAVVVPVTIDGSMNIMKKGSFIIQPADVKVTIHDTVILKDKDTKKAMLEIKEIIAASLRNS